MPMLSAAFVRSAKTPGTYHDRDGLTLRIAPGGSKQWIWRGTIRSLSGGPGRRVDRGLGNVRYTSLAEAREIAFEYRKLSRAGVDPRTGRTVEPSAGLSTAPTFEEAVERVLTIHAPTWRGDRQEKAWRSTLATYAYPKIGSKPVDVIETADILRVLTPIWNTKRETAKRVRNRISKTMQWVVAKGYRKDNPAGRALGAALPKNGGRTRHHKAMPHAEVGAALDKARAADARHPSFRLVFEFVVLTAARGGEARAAQWSEIDRESRTWVVPASRMKSKREHRVPLSDQAVRVLDDAAQHRVNDLVFPSATGKVIAASQLSTFVRELKIGGVLHGFRSSFRDWATETGVRREAAERSLAHTVPGVEGAYDRTTLFEERREVMQRWAEYVAG